MDYKQIWEDFSRTWMAVITRPEEFFSTWNPAESWQKVLIFNLICGLIGGLLTAVFTLFFGIGAILRYPLFVIAGTVIGGVILFVCFKLLGGNGEIEPTLKMVGYTQAVRAIYIGLPGLGFILSFLAGLYQIWLLVVGGKAVHGLDTTQAAIAVLLPVAVFGFLSFLAALLFGIGMMGFLMHAGGG